MTIQNRFSEYCFDGLYEPAEAAKYIYSTLNSSDFKVDSTKILRWIRKGLSSHDLINKPGREINLNFPDLISMRIISALRAAGISFAKIYTAEKWLRDKFDLPCPFATEMLWTNKSDVFLELKNQLVAASKYGQYAFEIMEENLIPVHGLLFDEETKIAKTWEVKQNILINPLIQFGSPCIKGTRVPTSAIWAMIMGGDSFEYVSNSYNVDIKEAEQAFEWENSIRNN